MQDTMTQATLPTFATDAELHETGYGQVWERNGGCDKPGCRHGLDALIERRRTKAPGFNPVRAAEGVMQYCADAMGMATPVYFVCRECEGIGSQLDIC